ncbi:hypothetical protein BO83DRAFT_381675 [Aspergillus eucalypticola CBS 122712]|uniref:Uncharacterized protein n=1 Tax=Aspergillus eucalypticola (strain CBS 122712 / IBT 29274) TaxID=1448314 RepID=A0A317UTS4_ASPEC|nr:uncharacterized protein BO83DRAFT_381675 [Aspergillus eucalypticola CBS 122712]PWY64871.1 hypothetical protein BO83DRAFT_381675 [Aspergillus eucalypticola CBS 122712]
MIGEKAADEWVARMAYLKPPGWERVETGSSWNVDWLTSGYSGRGSAEVIRKDHVSTRRQGER